MSLQHHGQGNHFSSPAPATYSFSSPNLRFFATFSIVILGMMLITGWFSMATLKPSHGSENLFYHPLIYQVALSQSTNQTILQTGSAIKSYPQQTLLLLQVSVNFFYLVFLIILIMLCMALAHDWPANMRYRKFVQKKVCRLFGIYKGNHVSIYRHANTKLVKPGFSHAG